MKKTAIIIFIAILLIGCSVEKKANEFNEQEFYKVTEIMPEPIGGIESIQSKIKYPESAKKAGVQGKVHIQVFIDEKGKVSRALAFKGLNSECNEVALNAIRTTDFNPGLNNGKPVKSQILIPILFLPYDKQIQSENDLSAKSNMKYFSIVQQMPEPIGGVLGIMKKIKYPELAKKAGVQGKVHIKAFIDETGKVIKTEVIKGIGSGCDEEAVNAVKNTKFTPGMENQKAVKTQVIIPVAFKLK